jgi:hypothetical protein
MLTASRAGELILAHRFAAAETRGRRYLSDGARRTGSHYCCRAAGKRDMVVRRERRRDKRPTPALTPSTSNANRGKSSTRNSLAIVTDSPNWAQPSGCGDPRMQPITQKNRACNKVGHFCSLKVCAPPAFTDRLLAIPPSHWHFFTGSARLIVVDSIRLVWTTNSLLFCSSKTI